MWPSTPRIPSSWDQVPGFTTAAKDKVVRDLRSQFAEHFSSDFVDPTRVSDAINSRYRDWDEIQVFAEIISLAQDRHFDTLAGFILFNHCGELLERLVGLPVQSMDRSSVRGRPVPCQAFGIAVGEGPRKIVPFHRTGIMFATIIMCTKTPAIGLDVLRTLSRSPAILDDTIAELAFLNGNKKIADFLRKTL